MQSTVQCWCLNGLAEVVSLWFEWREAFRPGSASSRVRRFSQSLLRILEYVFRISQESWIEGALQEPLTPTWGLGRDGKWAGDCEQGDTPLWQATGPGRVGSVTLQFLQVEGQASSWRSWAPHTVGWSGWSCWSKSRVPLEKGGDGVQGRDSWSSDRLQEPVELAVSIRDPLGAQRVRGQTAGRGGFREINRRASARGGPGYGYGLGGINRVNHIFFYM